MTSRITSLNGCQNQINQSVDSVPKNVIGCMYDPNLDAYVKYTAVSGFNVQKFYKNSSCIQHFVFSFEYVFNVSPNRNVRYLNGDKNAVVNVISDGSGIPIRAIINGNTYNIVQSYPNITDDEDIVRFREDVFSDGSIYYNTLISSSNPDNITYRIDFNTSGLPAYTKRITVLDSGSDITSRRFKNFSSQVITHAKLVNTTTNTSIYIKFDNFDQNDLVYVIYGSGVNMQTQTAGKIISNFPDGTVYNKCYVGWLDNKIVPPNSLDGIVLKNSNVLTNEFIYFYCGQTNPSYVRYIYDLRNPRYEEFGSHVYVNYTGVTTLTPTTGYGKQETRSTLKFIDGFFYSSIGSNVFIPLPPDIMDFTSAVSQLNFIGFSRYCQISPTLSTPVNPSLYFNTYEEVSFPILSMPNYDGYPKFINSLKITYRPHNYNIITFYDEKNIQTTIHGISYSGAESQGYRYTHFLINGNYYRIINRDFVKNEIITQRVNITDSVIRTSGSITSFSPFKVGTFLNTAPVNQPSTFTLSDGIYTGGKLTDGINDCIVIVFGNMINIGYINQNVNDTYMKNTITFFNNKKTRCTVAGLVSFGADKDLILRIDSSCFLRYTIVSNRIRLLGGDRSKETFLNLYLTANDTLKQDTGNGTIYSLTKDNTNVSLTFSINDVFILDGYDSDITPFDRMVLMSNMRRIGTSIYFIDNKYRVFEMANDSMSLTYRFMGVKPKIFKKCTTTNYIKFIQDSNSGNLGDIAAIPMISTFSGLSYNKNGRNTFETHFINSGYSGNFKYIRFLNLTQSYDFIGNDISSGIYTDIRNVIELCNSTNNAVGFVVNPATKQFWIKSNMSSGTASSSIDAYKYEYFYISRFVPDPNGGTSYGCFTDNNGNAINYYSVIYNVFVTFNTTGEISITDTYVRSGLINETHQLKLDIPLEQLSENYSHILIDSNVLKVIRTSVVNYFNSTLGKYVNTVIIHGYFVDNKDVKRSDSSTLYTTTQTKNFGFGYYEISSSSTDMYSGMRTNVTMIDATCGELRPYCDRNEVCILNNCSYDISNKQIISISPTSPITGAVFNNSQFNNYQGHTFNGIYTLSLNSRNQLVSKWFSLKDESSGMYLVYSPNALLSTNCGNRAVTSSTMQAFIFSYTPSTTFTTYSEYDVFNSTSGYISLHQDWDQNRTLSLCNNSIALTSIQKNRPEFSFKFEKVGGDPFLYRIMTVPTNNYTRRDGWDQDNQTITRYTGIDANTCQIRCNEDTRCNAIAHRNDNSQCWTLWGTPSPYTRGGNSLYNKPSITQIGKIGNYLSVDNSKTNVNFRIEFPWQNYYINYGTKTIKIGTRGFTLKTRITFHSFRNWMRIIDFNNGRANNDILIAIAGTDGRYLRFSYRDAYGVDRVVDFNVNFSLNTLYNIMLVYNPLYTINGTTTLFINGTSLPSVNMSGRAVDVTVNNTYVGKSSYIEDDYLSATIHNLDVWDYAAQNSYAAVPYKNVYTHIDPNSVRIVMMPNLRLIGNLGVINTGVNNLITNIFNGYQSVNVTYTQITNFTDIDGDYNMCFNFRQYPNTDTNRFPLYYIQSSAMCGGTCRSGSNPEAFLQVNAGGTWIAGDAPASDAQRVFYIVDLTNFGSSYAGIYAIVPYSFTSDTSKWFFLNGIFPSIFTVPSLPTGQKISFFNNLI